MPASAARISPRQALKDNRLELLTWPACARYRGAVVLGELSENDLRFLVSHYEGKLAEVTSELEGRPLAA